MSKEETSDITEETVEKKTAKASKKSSKKKKESPTEKLQNQISELEEERDELKDKFVRKVAEFDNFKRRTSKERIELIGTANRETINAMLPVIDDFERAIKAANDDASAEPVSEGVMMVYNKLVNILAQKGLKPMESTGEAFNPDLHEAITEIPAPSEEMKGKIIDTIEKGYYLNEKLIRYPRVVVGK